MIRIALPFTAVLAVSLAACTPPTAPADDTTSPAMESTPATSHSSTTAEPGMPPTDMAQTSNPNLPADAAAATNPDMRSTTEIQQDPSPPTTPMGISEQAPPLIDDPAPTPPPTQ